MNTFMTLCASMALTLTAFATNNNDGTTRYKVDASASSVTWHATKVTGEHMGTVNLANGYLSVTDGNLTSANVIVDMQTIAPARTWRANGATSSSVTSTAMTFSMCQNTKQATFTFREHDPIEKCFRATRHTR